MKNCNETCYNLCEVSACFGDKYILSFPFIADAEGVYTLELDFMDASIIENQTFEQNDDIVFELYLNENQEYLARVTDNNGDILVYNEGDKNYTCFIIKTKMKIKVCN